MVTISCNCLDCEYNNYGRCDADMIEINNSGECEAYNEQQKRSEDDE